MFESIRFSQLWGRKFGAELSLLSLGRLLAPDTPYAIFIQNKWQGLALPCLSVPSAADILPSKIELPVSTLLEKGTTDLFQILSFCWKCPQTEKALSDQLPLSRILSSASHNLQLKLKYFDIYYPTQRKQCLKGAEEQKEAWLHLICSTLVSHLTWISRHFKSFDSKVYCVASGNKLNTSEVWLLI